MDGESFWTTLPGVLTALTGMVTAIATLVGALYSAGIVGKRGAVASPSKGPAPSPEPSSEPSPEPSGEPSPRPRAARTLRALPAILEGRDVTAQFVRHGFFDRRLNPAGRGVEHDYESRVIGREVVVVDHATGLMWQHGGSDQPRVLADAEGYVGDLNRDRFAGFADWRLPTVEEVASLIEPHDQDGVHLSPAFRPGASIVWTADRHPDGCGWIAYFGDALVACESPAFNGWVRAVRTLAAGVHAGIR